MLIDFERDWFNFLFIKQTWLSYIHYIETYSREIILLLKSINHFIKQLTFN